MDKVFKALADPGRRKLLDQLHADNGQDSRRALWTPEHVPPGRYQAP